MNSLIEYTPLTFYFKRKTTSDWPGGDFTELVHDLNRRHALSFDSLSHLEERLHQFIDWWAEQRLYLAEFDRKFHPTTCVEHWYDHLWCIQRQLHPKYHYQCRILFAPGEKVNGYLVPSIYNPFSFIDFKSLNLPRSAQLNQDIPEDILEDNPENILEDNPENIPEDCWNLPYPHHLIRRMLLYCSGDKDEKVVLCNYLCECVDRVNQVYANQF